jgi:hypothetical protein
VMADMHYFMPLPPVVMLPAACASGCASGSLAVAWHTP